MFDVKVPLSKKKTAALREQFALFDKDGDGTISVRELGSVLKSIGLEPEPHQLQRLIDIADTDRSGVVEFEEFTRLMSDETGTLEMDEEELTEAFAEFDKDRNGSITKSELKFVSKQLGMETDDVTLDHMIQAADKDKDGTVSYREFVMVLMRK